MKKLCECKLSFFIYSFVFAYVYVYMYVVCVCTQTNFAPYTWPCFAIFILCHKPLPNAYNRNTHTNIHTYVQRNLHLHWADWLWLMWCCWKGKGGSAFVWQSKIQDNAIICLKLCAGLNAGSNNYIHTYRNKKKTRDNNNKNHWIEGRRCGKTQTRTTAIKMQSKAKWTHRKDRATKLF